METTRPKVPLVSDHEDRSVEFLLPLYIQRVWFQIMECLVFVGDRLEGRVVRGTPSLPQPLSDESPPDLLQRPHGPPPPSGRGWDLTDTSSGSPLDPRSSTSCCPMGQIQVYTVSTFVPGLSFTSGLFFFWTPSLFSRRRHGKGGG